MNKLKFILMTVIACWSCQSNDEIDQPTSLKGTTWKLAGIVDAETGDLKVLEPKDCTKCYVLIFDTDSTLTGTTVSNEFLGTYEISTHSIQISGKTEVVEYYDGDLYYYTLAAIPSFSIKENELILYYNDNKNYLLFKPLKP